MIDLYRNFIHSRTIDAMSEKREIINDKNQKLLDEARKLLIVSSFHDITSDTVSNLKKSCKKLNVLDNTYGRSGSVRSIVIYPSRTIKVDNILSIEKKDHQVIDFSKGYENYYADIMIHDLDRAHDLLNTGERRSSFIIKREKSREVTGRYDDSFDAKKDLPDGFVPITSQNTKLSIAKEATVKLRQRKIHACKLKYEQHMSNNEILKVVPLTRNQLKDALKNWNIDNLDQIRYEHRGMNKKDTTIRTEENINWIKNYLGQTVGQVTIREVQKRFEDEVLGFKISKSLMYDIVKHDCNMKYGIVRRQAAAKNSDDNKSYRIHVIQQLVNRYLNEQLIISIDETGFSDYVNKIKVWYDPSNDFKMKIKQKTQTITYSLLCATSQNQVVGYYIVQGAVNSIIYRSFLERIYEKARYYIAFNTRVTIMMDNARFHKAAFVKDLMLRHKDIHHIYMPAYSPEINFIENVFNRIKQRFNKLPLANNK